MQFTISIVALSVDLIAVGEVHTKPHLLQLVYHGGQHRRRATVAAATSTAQEEAEKKKEVKTHVGTTHIHFACEYRGRL